jgi:O-antigen ligase
MKFVHEIRHALIGNPGNIWLDTFLLIVLASGVLGFLALRGCTNTALLLLLFPALFNLRGAYSAARTDGALGSMLPVIIALALPVMVMIICQSLRQELLLKAYDGPMRMLIAIPLMFYLYSKRVDFARLLGVVAPLALFVLVAEVHLNPHVLERWGGRFATYSVDTDMFGVYTLVLAAFCLFGIDQTAKASGKGLLALQISGFVAGVYLVVGSNTRASWLALPFMLLLWPVLRGSRLNRRITVVVSSLVIVGLVIGFALYPGAAARLASGYHEISQWLDGSNPDTSTGLRLTMWQMSWEFFKHNPWIGYGDIGVRAYLNEPWITSISSTDARAAIFAGPHNEFLANILRSGVLGGISVLFLFFAPFAFFWRQRHNADAQVASASHLGLAYLICLTICSIGFDVFTLKYTASFYGLIIAGLTAQVMRGWHVGERRSEAWR